MYCVIQILYVCIIFLFPALKRPSHVHGHTRQQLTRASHVLRGRDLVTDWPPASGLRTGPCSRSWQNKKLSAPGSRMKQGSDSQPVSGRRELHNKSNVITFTPVCILSIVEHLNSVQVLSWSRSLVFLFDRNRWDVYSRDKHCILQIYRTICQKNRTNIYLKYVLKVYFRRVNLLKCTSFYVHIYLLNFVFKILSYKFISEFIPTTCLPHSSCNWIAQT